jgi:hypothetical protein
MTLEDAYQRTAEMRERAEADGDHYLFVYFSREEDKYRATADLDAGDALIVIGQLIEKFNLSAEAIGCAR